MVNLYALALGLGVNDLGACGSIGSFVSGQRERTDGSVRADICALVALDALRSVPLGNHNGNAALLVSGSAQLELAVDVTDEGGNGQAVAVHIADGLMTSRPA